MASTALVTIWEARDELASSVARASSSSALAKMMPSWLFSRWKSVPRSVGWSICSGSVCKCGYGIWLRIVLADLSVRLDGRNLARGVRNLFIPDFSGWTDPEVYQSALAGLLTDLALAPESI